VTSNTDRYTQQNRNIYNSMQLNNVSV